MANPTSPPFLISPTVVVTGEGALPSVFDVTSFVTGAIASVGESIADLIEVIDGRSRPAVHVDQRLASLWMGTSIRPIGWELPGPWDAVAGDYRSADGWIRLHTNATTHREAALEVLGCAPEREAVQHAVSMWSGEELEMAVHAAGGVAGVMRTAVQWAEHPQGNAVRTEPLMDRVVHPESVAMRPSRFSVARPLDGVRVLDLTKVLAGPVATRVLAALGADVIRIDAADWSEPGVSQDTTVGKRCVHIDMRSPAGSSALRELYRTCDIFVHGYRPGALDTFGLHEPLRRELNPAAVEVCLDAYGFTGPWSSRRGFDSVVQMSCGIAAEGMSQFGRDRPTPLPAQALDHVTGYLMAEASLRGWYTRLTLGHGSCHRASLARTACALMDGPPGNTDATITPVSDDDLAAETEHTSWGPALRLKFPLVVDGVRLVWDRPAVALGTHSVPIDWLPIA